MPAQALIRHVPRAQIDDAIAKNNLGELVELVAHDKDVLVRAKDNGSGGSVEGGAKAVQLIADLDAIEVRKEAERVRLKLEAEVKAKKLEAEAKAKKP